MRQEPDIDERIDERDLLARLGLACLVGRHWPIAGYAPYRADRATSACADCGRAMRRRADGRWVAAPLRTPARAPIAAGPR